MKLLFLILTLFISTCSFSQIKKRTRKISNDKGTFFTSWGFHRSVYSESDLQLSGYGYNFDLAHSKAHDQQSTLKSGDYSLTSISVPQYNFKIGYYYKKKWNFALAVDHMKYIFSDYNQVALTGFVVIPDKTVTLGNDFYFTNIYQYSQSLKTNRNTFHFQNDKALNYIHGEIGFTEPHYVAGKRGNFVLSSNIGGGLGVLYSYANLLYDGVQSKTAQSLSGYGLSGFAGLRFEIYKHFYLYTNLSVGFLHKIYERTSLEDPTAYAKQHFGYSQIEAGLGIFVFKKIKNGCDDCPVW